jgi:hypothetical protein
MQKAKRRELRLVFRLRKDINYILIKRPEKIVNFVKGVNALYQLRTRVYKIINRLL